MSIENRWFFDSNICVFDPIDLIFALSDDIYLQFDDPEGILKKNWKFEKLELKTTDFRGTFLDNQDQSQVQSQKN